MEYDDLELDTLGERKTALFVIISDTDATFNFVVSIMYSQLFNLLCDKADDVYNGRLPVHVRMLLDEFANIGQIPQFEKTGKALMSEAEIAVMDGGKCIMQLRGVRPFFSDKFDITKHKRYKELSDYDSKSAFDIEDYVKHQHRMKLTPDTVEPEKSTVTLPNVIIFGMIPFPLRRKRAVTRRPNKIMEKGFVI